MLPRHIWFDVNGAMYRIDAHMGALILDRMYSAIAQATGRRLDQALQKEYDDHYADLQSHKLVFSKRYELSPDVARGAQAKANVARHIMRDKQLLGLFRYLNRRKIPCSIYSNSYSGAIRVILNRLGLMGAEFTFKHMLTGDTPKYDGIVGFQRALELSMVSKERAHEVLFVGDREKIDIAPAREAGMSTALVWVEGLERIVEERDVSRKSAHFKCPDIYSVKQVVQRLERSG